MRRISAVAALCAAAVMASGCASTVVVGRPSAAESTVVAAAALSPSAAANRAVCVDLDARGGSLYALFVVPMMAGPTGQTSVSVDASSMARATTALVGLGASSLDGASGDIRDHGERLSASAGAMGIHDDAEGTAVLTSFVSLAVACQVAGHRPSWFDAEALAR
jgi:hypothetical protein